MEKGRETNMHISYKPLWHTLVERDMRKEDLRLAAGLTTNMIANMSKEGKNISMDTLVRICETLDCGILDVIELASDEPSVTEKRKQQKGQLRSGNKQIPEWDNQQILIFYGKFL